MKISHIQKCFLFAVCLALLLPLSCTNDDPAVIFDPNDKGTAAPVISAVEPAGEAVAGVSRITIRGSHFSPVIAENAVFFGTDPAKVVVASETELRVIPANKPGENLTIRVSVQKSFVIAEFAPYKLQPITTQYGNFINIQRIRSIAVDDNENVYISPPRAVIKIDPNLDFTQYGTLPFVSAASMRWGPGGYLYVQRNNNDRLYRMPPGGGDAELLLRFPERVFFFDFDENGNIYNGGKLGLFLLQKDSTEAIITGQYADDDIIAIRVFDGYVYVAAMGDAQSGVWRNQILDDQGALGDRELYFDWASADSSFSPVDINDITFAEDGDLVIASDKRPQNPDDPTSMVNPILIVHPDGGTENLYEGLLKFPVENFVWGNDQFVYVNHGNIDLGITRLAMGKNGATHHGR